MRAPPGETRSYQSSLVKTEIRYTYSIRAPDDAGFSKMKVYFSRAVNRHLKISSLGLVEEVTNSSGSQAFLAYSPLHVGFGRTQSPRCQVFQGADGATGRKDTPAHLGDWL